MKITKFKTLAVSVLAGGMVFGGCLGGLLNPKRLLQEVVIEAGLEFVLDNGQVFDLFPDSSVDTAIAEAAAAAG